ncbi:MULTISPECIES: glycosyltransferase family 10 domain-containing protein [unclassified Marinobacterium]|uniref:glycosyltransferase family 10 domain-containing protein n=1 Tax=unclassified Marinobacterium TaxID=2644139 RepID=UPI001568C523|nr:MULTISPECIES: glycosyltransferase family 10 [unclassified Marinobacterium]
MSRPGERVWRHQLNSSYPVVNNCTFTFDIDEREYDWLVVYDDLPPSNKERRSMRQEKLACPPEKTILVTSEPSSIKSYFSEFTDQFGFVLTSQPEWALPHKNRIFSQPALQWFYGVGSKNTIDFEGLHESNESCKDRLISVVGSSKKEKHTLHALRYQFIKALTDSLPNIDIYGRGFTEMDDKAEAIQPYMFHIAVENHYSEHHWTEKLADAFLGEAVPLYVGCPNIKQYFPEDSIIILDISNPEEAIKTISSLTAKEYFRRRPAVLEAKRKILHEYNLFSVIEKIVNSANTKTNNDNETRILKSRRSMIKRSLRSSVKHLYQKIRLRIIHRYKDSNLLKLLN